MIILLKPDTTRRDIDEILSRIAGTGLKPLYMPGIERTVLGAIGDERVLAGLRLENYACVERITPVLTPYKLVSKEAHPAESVVTIGDRRIGGGDFLVIAGPCAVESEEQMCRTAEAVKAGGAGALRGGAFKPRTSPYSFQGLGLRGLEMLRDASKQCGLPAVTEVLEAADVEAVAACADVFQVGSRNMQNYRLLTVLGRQHKPVILKRGMSATIEDMLLAAEYIVSEGNPRVILCERGIRTFETATRNTLDLNAVPFLKSRSHLPVIVDPSHGTGLRELVAPMAKAAVACGADGLMIEVHHDPTTAMSDGPQSLDPGQFAGLMRDLDPFITAAGKRTAAAGIIE
ncbi:3-deoxy-7-phosphoheptulonate synthase [bacterium]|nr:3-deoxy-7-phosphoheptulonate synthase [bacterium]